MLKQLKIYYIFVSMPFIAVLLGAAIFYGAIKSTITSNPHPQINFIIFFIILSGGTLILFNARRLMREAKALTEFSGAIHAKTDLTTLQEMADKYDCDIACLLQMIATSGDRSISHQEQAALEHELANVNLTLNRRNSLPQYLTGLLVGMGLLGTFIGLLATLGDITALISSFADLDMSKADPIAVFRNMIEKMKAPMSSMAIAFSASMFGLLGSIILGLMMVGIRRLQGDVYSVLSSEIARHIELALSFESISFGGGNMSTGDEGGLTSKILLRIEERLAEAARLRQRALSSEIDDFKKQRADMLRALTEQTEANNNFRSELQQLGSNLGAITNVMEKGTGEMARQISDLTINLAGDAKENHKLLALQVDEQKGLNAAIQSFKTETSNSFRSELQQIGSQLGSMSNIMEKGNDEVSAQISELRVHTAADAKESHRLLNITSNNVRSELQQVGSQLASISTFMERSNTEKVEQISELMRHMADDAEESRGQRTDMLNRLIEQIDGNNNVRSELQELGSRFGAISSLIEKGNGELANQISEMTAHIDDDAKESQEQRAHTLRTLVDQVEAGNSVRSDLQQLGGQLGTILESVEKGSGVISRQISELMDRMAADAKETDKLLDVEADEEKE